MSNLNDGVGKKIVEALKKQTEINEETLSAAQEDNTEAAIDIDTEALDKIAVPDLISSDTEPETEPEPIVMEDLFDNGLGTNIEEDTAINSFLHEEEKTHDTGDVPANILILKKLVSQLPSGVTRHTGAQIIRQTIEALGISMKSVLTEAQEYQSSLKEASKECQMTIQEYKQKISSLEKQTQNYQKQFSALNDLISLFIQTGK